MDTIRCHRASEYALQSRKMAIALPDELQESEGPCTNRALRAVCGRSLIFGNLPANHRASECALESPGRPIRVPGELQESVGPGSDGRVWPVADLR